MEGPATPKLIVILFFFLLVASLGHGCEWARGYFHQVTALKGTVVGNRFLPRWLRRLNKVSNADLTLFEYQSVLPSRIIATTRTDSAGKFSFPALNRGHYTLKIRAGDHEDYFDIEVTDTVAKTDKVLIDISPVEPDCTGGHEFEVYPKHK